MRLLSGAMYVPLTHNRMGQQGQNKQEQNSLSFEYVVTVSQSSDAEYIQLHTGTT